ncbi:MAG TPA: NAD(P)-dependent oxidoreductase [Streptosporangiaceae bacterium]|nr:NAD(P)-dependent oxidoreductase [Streptosporangiaceae bacterium]
MRVLVAGATGAVGRQLVPQLVAAAHQVSGTTRSQPKMASLRAAGAEPYLLDGLDRAAVGEVVAQARPDVIVHEMTAIPAELNFRTFDRTFAATSRLRTTAVDHLLAAARAEGVPRIVVQSYAGWPNSRTGGPVKTEEDPLDPDPPAAMRATLDAIRYLERAVTSAPLEGVVLRYGSLYGPGASEMFVRLLRRRRVPVLGDGSGVWSFLHVTDAATATVAALSQGDTGIYNVVDDDPAPVAEWLPVLARCAGAPPPRHVPAWLGRLAAGEPGLSVMTQVRGSSNAKAKRELRWTPIWATWREGFATGLDRAYPDGASERRPVR